MSLKDFEYKIKGFIELSFLNLYYYVNRYRPKVSFCTSVKDRFEHLEQTFIRNIEDNASYPDCEFVLLNYSCPDPRTEAWAKTSLMPYIEQGKVNYYYYPDTEFFEMAHARNLAFRLATGDVVCNVDADNFTGRHFVKYVVAALAFYGDLVLMGRRNDDSAGRICVRRKDWEQVGGYDERFKNWGNEEIDLCNRLQMNGLRSRYILPYDHFCQFIRHSDEVRNLHFREDKSVSYSKQFEIRTQNMKDRNICPNGSNFGHGRVLKNFSEWIEV